MIKVTIFCALQAAVLQLIIRNHQGLKPWIAFLISFLSFSILTGTAYTAKGKAVEQGKATMMGKIAATVLTWMLLLPVSGTYIELWKQNLWPKPLLLWIALLAMILIWVPNQAWEE